MTRKTAPIEGQALKRCTCELLRECQFFNLTFLSLPSLLQNILLVVVSTHVFYHWVHHLLQKRQYRFQGRLRAEAAVPDTFVWEEVCSLFHHPTFLTWRIQVTNRSKTLACRVSVFIHRESTSRRTLHSPGLPIATCYVLIFVCSGFNFIFHFSSGWKYNCDLFSVATELDLASSSSMTPGVQCLPYLRQT